MTDATTRSSEPTPLEVLVDELAAETRAYADRTFDFNQETLTMLLDLRARLSAAISMTAMLEEARAASAPASPLATVRLSTGRLYLDVCGVAVAVEGDPCRDPSYGNVVWTGDSLQQVADKINKRFEPPPYAPTRPSEPTVNDVGDYVCEHGTAMDVHCCGEGGQRYPGCHSGFVFDLNACECCLIEPPSAPPEGETPRGMK